ncbi:hypothetical protein ABZX75_32760 [Streptomyces sp. NPDC003038]|uniref:hypothetical protein n=1 Tax=unclassified Streptomyces TaxID=2593676 RepID=UPI0033A592F8
MDDFQDAKGALGGFEAGVDRLPRLGAFGHPGAGFGVCGQAGGVQAGAAGQRGGEEAGGCVDLAEDLVLVGGGGVEGVADGVGQVAQTPSRGRDGGDLGGGDGRGGPDDRRLEGVLQVVGHLGQRRELFGVVAVGGLVAPVAGAGDLRAGEVPEVDGAGGGVGSGAGGVLEPELGGLHAAGEVQEAGEEQRGGLTVGPGLRVEREAGEGGAVDEGAGQRVQGAGGAHVAGRIQDELAIGSAAGPARGQERLGVGGLR